MFCTFAANVDIELHCFLLITDMATMRGPEHHGKWPCVLFVEGVVGEWKNPSRLLRSLAGTSSRHATALL